MYLSIPETDTSNYLTYSTQFGESAFCVHNLCLPFFTVMVLSYDQALSWTCILEYKLVFKKKKKNLYTVLYSTHCDGQTVIVIPQTFQ
jgi:hypothetical protein